MPTVLRLGPYRFFFYSSDRGEPLHVHVERDNNRAKFWLNPVRVVESVGFGRAELNKLRKLVAEQEAIIERAWHEFFGR